MDLKYVRKEMYVTEKTPAIAVDEDGYVRCGLTAKMNDNDLLVLGLVLALKNKDWKAKVIERVRTQMEGASTPMSAVTRAFDLIKK
tara:strand:- start:23207 stop:23464 length:258 start_codon:yes stop_codon:yes gene_type:complete